MPHIILSRKAFLRLIFVYVVELYPTTVRTIGTGSASMCARVGAIIAPYVIFIPTTWIPYAVYAGSGKYNLEFGNGFIIKLL